MLLYDYRVLDLTTIIGFLGVSMLITLMPGPDNLFVLALGMGRGARAAVPLALGLACGNFFHTAAVALGVSALIVASPNALLALKWLGCSYLLFIAYQIATTPQQLQATAIDTEAISLRSDRHFFFRGLLMNVLNPKVVVFFLAFLPQFVSTDRPSPTTQTILLGSLFVVQTAIIFSAIALLAGRISRLLRRHSAVHTSIRWTTAGLVIVLALNLLLSNIVINPK